GRVSLTLYDQMGRPVRRILDADKLAGTYNIQMYRNGLGSGVYYYKLDTQTESVVRKMTIN
ncbi:MAG TPA: T9SS type A sorting domain-containing protein, partial [Puia sp.]